jgi:alpha/beta superfamily hydrolase
MKFVVIKMLGLILFLYIGVNSYLYITQDEKIFNRKRVDKLEPKIAKRVEFNTTDGTILEGAFIENKKDAPLVLYFGGNANSVIPFLDNVASKIKDFNFIAFNYAGYGNSTGKPSEEVILKHSNEIYSRYKPEVVIGRSLGSTVAIYVASKNNPKGVVLITPFDSILNVAKAKYPFLLVEPILKHKFEANRWAKDLKSKVAVILVENENIIPQNSLDNILNILSDKIVYKKSVKGVDHINIYSKDISKELKEAIEAVLK